MNISVVIPNYNGENLLKKNLPKVLSELKSYEKGKAEIIIVDDASTDNSVLSIKKYVSSIRSKDLTVKILENEKNLGFSSTVNKGVSKASYEILILLNTDVYPEAGFLNPLLEHFKNDPSTSSGEPSVFAVGCMDKSIEGDKTVLRGRGLGHWERGFLVHKRGEVNKTNTLWVSGGSGAFRKLIWEKLGGLNELYNPFYYEDIDLSYRALKSGYQLVFEPKSIVFHEHDKGAIKSKYSPFRIKVISYRNQFIFVWENATDFLLRLSHLLWLPYHFLKALVSKDLAFFYGFFKALIVLFKVIKERYNYQRFFIKKDSDIIKDYL